MSSNPEYLRPYHDAVRHFGPGFRATLWNSRESQILRFDVMIELTDFEGCTIVDAGSGTGDLAAHLHERGVAFKHYVGIDAMPQMTATAAKRNLPRCEFITGDFVADQTAIAKARPDWVVISGAMNTMDQQHAKRIAKRCFDIAAQGIVFNYLSDRPHKRWVNHETGPARRFDTVRMIDWALDHTPRVAFRQDYLDGHDATIMMRH